LKHKVNHRAYPTKEVNGMVFAYMGPKEKVPLFPTYEWFQLPVENLGITKFFNECNYLQALEGDCDSSHLDYLYRGNTGEGLVLRRSEAPSFEVERTWFGLRAAAIRKAPADQNYVRTSAFAMPCVACVPVGRAIDGMLDGFQVVYQVPADDTSTWRYNVRMRRKGPMWPEDVAAHRRQVGPGYRKIANLANDYLINRVKQKTVDYSGIEGFATEDSCVTETMGPIVDRRREHLGVSDSYVIALRKLLLEAVRSLDLEEEPPGLAREEKNNDFSGLNCIEVTIPSARSWKEFFGERA
jgi:hypothetical protein